MTIDEAYHLTRSSHAVMKSNAYQFSLEGMRCVVISRAITIRYMTHIVSIMLILWVRSGMESNYDYGIRAFSWL